MYGYRAKEGLNSPDKKKSEGSDKGSDDENEDKFYSDEEEEEDDEDEECSSPVHRPSDLKGLLKHKQKRSNIDLKAYKTNNKSKHRTLD